MNILLLTIALSGWMTNLYLILILVTKKNRDSLQRNSDSIQRIAEETNKQLEQNIEHLERITEMLEEENKNWEDLVKDYLERSEQK